MLNYLIARGDTDTSRAKQISVTLNVLDILGLKTDTPSHFAVDNTHPIKNYVVIC